MHCLHCTAARGHSAGEFWISALKLAAADVAPVAAAAALLPESAAMVLLTTRMTAQPSRVAFLRQWNPSLAVSFAAPETWEMAA